MHREAVAAGPALRQARLVAAERDDAAAVGAPAVQVVGDCEPAGRRRRLARADAHRHAQHRAPAPGQTPGGPQPRREVPVRIRPERTVLPKQRVGGRVQKQSLIVGRQRGRVVLPSQSRRDRQASRYLPRVLRP